MTHICFRIYICTEKIWIKKCLVGGEEKVETREGNENSIIKSEKPEKQNETMVAIESRIFMPYFENDKRNIIIKL